MDSRYYRPSSPGGRRLAEPARSSTGGFSTYDGYYSTQSARDQYTQPRSSAERVAGSSGGVVPISTTHYVTQPSNQTTRSSAGYDSFSGRPRRSTLDGGLDQARPASVVTSMPSRSRPTVIQSPVHRPASPLSRTTYERDPYSGASTSSTHHRHGHKKIYSVSDGKDAKLIAEKDLDNGRTRDYERRGRRESLDRGTTRRPSVDYGGRRESVDRHQRRESADRSGYKTTESRGRNRQTEYHLTGSANKPRVDDGYGYSYTDAAGMYRDTEPSWRPRRNSVDRASGRDVVTTTGRDRPTSLLGPEMYPPPPKSYTTRETQREYGPPPTTQREYGPPPTTRGFDKVNNDLLRTGSLSNPIRSPSRDRAPIPNYATYSNGDPYSTMQAQVPPRPASARPPPAVHQDREPRIEDPYRPRDEYVERRQPQRSSTYEDQDISKRGFGIRTDDYAPQAPPVHKVSPDMRPVYGSGPVYPDQATNPKNYTPEAMLSAPSRDTRERSRVRERDDYEMPPPRRHRDMEVSRDRGQDRDWERDMDRVRDVPRDRERDIPRDRERDIPRDRDRDIPRDRERDIPRDRERDIPRDRDRDIPRDWERERDVPREKPRETSDRSGLSKAVPVAAAAAGAFAVKEAMDRRNRDKVSDERLSADDESDRRRRRERAEAQGSSESMRDRHHPREMSRDREEPRRDDRRREERTREERPREERPREERPRAAEPAKPAEPTKSAEPASADDIYQQMLQQELQRTKNSERNHEAGESDREKERRRRERERESQKEKERERQLEQDREDSEPKMIEERTEANDPQLFAQHNRPERVPEPVLVGAPPRAQQEPVNGYSRERERQPSFLDDPLTQEPAPLPGQFPDEPPVDREQTPAEKEEQERKRRVQIVEPPKESPPPPRSILKQPTQKFPEDPNPIREGVAPLKDAKNKDKGVPPGARWTKIDRRLVNPQALEEKGERYEERLDCVIVLRVLSKGEIQKFADRTREIRDERYEQEREQRHSNRSRHGDRTRGDSSESGEDSDYEGSRDYKRDRARDRDDRRRDRDERSRRDDWDRVEREHDR